MMSLDFNSGTVVIPAAAAGDVVLRTFWGLTMNEWFYVAALAYTVVQIGAKAFDKWLEYKKMTLGGKE